MINDSSHTWSVSDSRLLFHPTLPPTSFASDRQACCLAGRNANGLSALLMAPWEADGEEDATWVPRCEENVTLGPARKPKVSTGILSHWTYASHDLDAA